MTDGTRYARYGMFSDAGGRAVAREVESFRLAVRAAMEGLMAGMARVALDHGEAADTAVREEVGEAIVAVAAEELLLPLRFKLSSVEDVVRTAYAAHDPFLRAL